MTCKHNLSPCEYEGSDKCSTCYTGQYHKEPEQKVRKTLARRAQRKDNRQGSAFEYANHQYNENKISASLTTNSGATRYEKGDEHLSGLVRVMQELKTQLPDRKGGTKSFSIKREWLDKLRKEAKDDFEFWYLLFSFSEPEGMAGDVYAVIERDLLSELILTVARLRNQVTIETKQRSLVEKKSLRIQAELSLERAKNAELEEELACQTIVPTMK